MNSEFRPELEIFQPNNRSQKKADQNHVFPSQMTYEIREKKESIQHHLCSNKEKRKKLKNSNFMKKSRGERGFQQLILFNRLKGMTSAHS